MDPDSDGMPEGLRDVKRGASARRADLPSDGGEADYDLVRAAQKGGREAFDRLMTRHQGSVATYLRRYSSRPGVVEELTQTVFIKAYVNIGSYKASAPFINWLLAIASRVGYDFWREEKKGRRVVYQESMDDYSLPQPAEVQYGQEEFDRLSAVMGKLPYTDRQVLYMAYIDGLSMAEIAQIMGWGVSMTKMRAFRARGRLRKLLQGADGI